MTENNNEVDAIYHLLEVEKEASSIIGEAVTKSENKLADAHAEYTKLYNEKYTKAIAKLEKKYESELTEAKKAYEEEINLYRQKLDAEPQNEKEFFTLLDKLLFK